MYDFLVAADRLEDFWNRQIADGGQRAEQRDQLCERLSLAEPIDGEPVEGKPVIEPQPMPVEPDKGPMPMAAGDHESMP